MAQYELNLRDYWQVIRKRYLVFLFIFLAVLVPSILYTNFQPSVYQASAAIKWQENRSLANLLTDLVRYETGDPMITQSKIITSIPVLERVVQDPGLGLLPKNATELQITEAASVVQGQVSTQILAESSVIRIIVTHSDPQMAANLANKIAEVYIDESLREKSKESRKVREFIEQQLQEVNTKLAAAEEKLAKFSEQEVPSGVGLPLQQRLSELEAKQQELLKQFTALHPDVKGIEAQIEELKKQLALLPWKELEFNRLTREIEVNTRLYHELKNKLEAARITEAEKTSDASLVDKAVPSYSPISPNRQLNYMLGILLGLTLGFASTFLVEQLDTSIGTIEDVEQYLKLPVLGVIPYLKLKNEKKKWPLQTLWTREYKGEKKIERLKNQLLFNYSGSSPIFEAYRILRTNIQTELFKEKTQGKVLILTSSGPEEGKSITTSNLAVVMAQAGIRTLLIDADMRRSTIHKIFGLKEREPGLSDILRETADSKEAIRTVTDILVGELGFEGTLKVPGLDNLNILTSGSSTAVTSELLSSGKMTELLEKLKTQFELILLDSPPVLAVADTLILAPKASGVILVYQVGRSGRTIVARAKRQLTESGAQVKGIILNNISPAVEMRYGYYYHYKYYGKYYGEKKEES